MKKNLTRADLLNKAKGLVGITTRIQSAEDYQAAIALCKIIVRREHPDVGGDEKKCTDANEARLIFAQINHFEKKVNRCLVCGETIARGATHCRTHHRAQGKAIAATGGTMPTEARKGNGNARVAPICDPFAPMGYYCAPVQKVVSKWLDNIGEPMLLKYFSAVAKPVVFKESELHLPFVPWQHLQAVFELGSAIVKVCADKHKPDAWILGGECAVNGSYESLNEIRDRIIRQGGKPFTVGVLAVALHRLKLSTPEETAKEFRQFRQLFRHYKKGPKM